jgi:hypothetical protein
MNWMTMVTPTIPTMTNWKSQRDYDSSVDISAIMKDQISIKGILTFDSITFDSDPSTALEFLVNIISAIRTEPLRDALQVDTGQA